MVQNNIAIRVLLERAKYTHLHFCQTHNDGEVQRDKLYHLKGKQKLGLKYMSHSVL